MKFKEAKPEPMSLAKARGFIQAGRANGSRPGVEMLRGIVLGICFVTPLATPATQHNLPPEDVQLIRIGTGGAHGTYFPIGSLIARIINDSSETLASAGAAQGSVLIAAAQISNGSVANVKALQEGRLEAALVQADIAFWAQTATAMFQGNEQVSNLRVVANLYPETVHLVARKGAGVLSVSHLRGRSVSLDGPGSGTLADARIILKAFNLHSADFEPVYLKPQFAAERLASGELDAFFIVAGHPTKAVADLANANSIHLVPIAGRPVANILHTHPYFSDTSIPAGTYKGVDRTATVAVGAQLIVNTTLDEEAIYHLTRALWSQSARTVLDEGHPKGREIQLQKALDGVAIPLHPGAERYYREVGLLKAASGSN